MGSGAAGLKADKKSQAKVRKHTSSGLNRRRDDYQVYYLNLRGEFYGFVCTKSLQDNTFLSLSLIDLATTSSCNPAISSRNLRGF
jgi:hypothetical protein